MTFNFGIWLRQHENRAYFVESGTVRVKCPVQEHNRMSPARTRTRIAWSEDERTNRDEATAPPKL